MRKTDGSGGRTPPSAGTGIAVKSGRGRTGRAPGCRAGNETSPARTKTTRGLRLVALLAAALAVGAIRPGGMTLAMDSSVAQPKVFSPEKVYPGVKLKESEVQEDNDLNPKTPSHETVPRKKKVSPGRKWKGSEVREDNDWNSRTPSQPLPSRQLPAGSKVETGGGDD